MKFVKIMLISSFLVITNSLYAQTFVKGMVSEEGSGKLIEGVVVTCMLENKVLSYDLTNSEGEYKLEIPSETFMGKGGTTLSIVFEHLSYEGLNVEIENKPKDLNVRLKVKTVQIKEVIVSAPSIMLRGDTLSYIISAFKGEADITLEDALKKLPGLQVEKDGTIKYLGRKLDNFYIENMDLLGGRYAVATRNIRADMIKEVEVIENHQPIKMLEKKEISDKVALNVKLNEEAKVKPSATLDGSLGYNKEEILYRLGLTGMLFTPKVQTIATVKYGNIATLASRDLANLVNNNLKIQNPASSVVGNISAGKPPLEESRYKSIIEGETSINNVKKISDQASLRLNIGYSYFQGNYTYSNESNYYIGESQNIVKEIMSPLNMEHKPKISLQYKLNGKERFIENNTWASIQILEGRYPTINGANTINQTKQALGYDINNSFHYNKLYRGNYIRFTSSINYLSTPKNSITYDSQIGKNKGYIQNSDGQSFVLKNSFSYSLTLGSNTRFFIPAALDFTYDRLNTSLISLQTSENSIKGFKIRPNINPRIEYIAPNNSLKTTLGASIAFNQLNYTQTSKNYSKFTIYPSLDINYAISPTSKLGLRASGGNTIGDITDFLINPIQTSYRTTSIKSGLLSENIQASSNISYEYKLPLSYLFLKANIGYNYQKRNLINSQKIDQDNIISTQLLSDNVSNGLISDFLISKLFKSIETKFNIGGQAAYNVGDIIQQGNMTRYYQLFYSVDGNISSRPWKWVELGYIVDIGWNSSWFNNTSNKLRSQSHEGKISIFPAEKVEIYSNIEYVNNQIAARDFISMALLDLGIKYKFKKAEIGLSVNNILDTKNYRYTIFSGLDSFSYNYDLRGREVVFSIKFF